MLTGYFTERPYRGLSENDILTHGSYFTYPNSAYDRKRASEDYNYYLDEYCYAEEMGFDGLGLNEHHGNPFCMGSSMNQEAAILARITDRARIILMGNPLPAHRNPMKLAEEIALIDQVSGGRLICGMLRGSGGEQFVNNANPAYNREMFEEAHDFIIQAWTRPGPWRYEGKHFHYRHVNPWVLPYQEPHPPIIVPGVLSVETALWSAEHRYPYLGLGTTLGPTAELWNAYADRAAELGYQAGSENFGYMSSICLAATEEKAYEVGRHHLFANGQGNFARAEYTLPAGFNSPAAIKRLAAMPSGSWLGLSREKLMASERPMTSAPDHSDTYEKIDAAYRQQVDEDRLLVGTPDTVLPKLKRIMRTLRPGIFMFMNVQGNASNSERMTTIELLGKEVLPELRRYAKELGLTNPIDTAPGSTPLAPGQARAEVINLADEPAA